MTESDLVVSVWSWGGQEMYLRKKHHRNNVLIHPYRSRFDFVSGAVIYEKLKGYRITQRWALKAMPLLNYQFSYVSIPPNISVKI